MTTTKITESVWYPEKRLVVTQISGEVEIHDIEKWENAFRSTLEQIEESTTFKMFVNMYGFNAMNIEAHKRFRGVIPLTLADYGWKVGYVDLFEEEAKTITYKNTRGIQCLAAAHSHQDEIKMNKYETLFGCGKEHFFSDPTRALQWIENLDIVK